ncbi:hypothetical protein ABPG74_014583 [Tetrahymena malaccensis]
MSVWQLVQFEQTQKEVSESILKDVEVTDQEAKDFVWSVFKSQWKMVVLTQIVGLASTSMTVIKPFLIQNFIKKALQGNIEPLKYEALQYMFVIILLRIFQPLKQYIYLQYRIKMKVKIKEELYYHILSKDITFFEVVKVSELKKIFEKGVDSVVELASASKLYDCLSRFIEYLGNCIFVLKLSWHLALIMIGFSAIQYIWNKISEKKKKEIIQRWNDSKNSSTGNFEEVVQHAHLVKSFAKERQEIKSFIQNFSKLEKQSNWDDFLFELLQSINYFLLQFQIPVILYIGAVFFIYEGNLQKIGILQTLVNQSFSFTYIVDTFRDLYILMLSSSEEKVLMTKQVYKLYKLKAHQGLCEDYEVKKPEETKEQTQITDDTLQLSKNFLTVQEELPAVEYFKLNRQISSVHNEELKGNIVFDNVSFKYTKDKEKYALRNISFEAKEGQSIAIVGNTGSGKSTIVKMIERFLDPDYGQVLINGLNLMSIPLKQLRMSVGYVQQEPILFNRTIEENITYGVEKYSDQDIEEICEKAGVADFIFDPERFPEVLKTKIGVKGTQLSGGEKQRIAIARALLKKPKILIFDEATSALDSECEFQVQQCIDSLIEKREMTIFIVAHRLSTISTCDKILVMKKGELVQQGTHEELLEDEEGAYKKLIHRQLILDKEMTKQQKAQYFRGNSGDIVPEEKPQIQKLNELKEEHDLNIARSVRQSMIEMVKNKFYNSKFLDLQSMQNEIIECMELAAFKATNIETQSKLLQKYFKNKEPQEQANERKKERRFSYQLTPTLKDEQEGVYRRRERHLTESLKTIIPSLFKSVSSVPRYEPSKPEIKLNIINEAGEVKKEI